MKTIIKSFFFIFIFQILIITSFADNPASATAGENIDIVIPIENDYSIRSDDIDKVEGLPDNCSFSIKDGKLHLIGTPMIAGEYSFFIPVFAKGSEDTENKDGEIPFTITVNASRPVVTLQPGTSMQKYEIYSHSGGKELTLYADGKVNDGGTLKYQWYISEDGSYDKSARISGATEKEYTPSYDIPGTKYYFCRLINDNNGYTARSDSNIVILNVIKPEIVSVEIYRFPDKVNYSPEEEIDTEGLLLKVLYSSGQHEIVSDGYSFDNTELSREGVFDIVGDYSGFPFSFTVSVHSGKLSGLSVLTTPAKTIYLVGEPIDLSGLILLAESKDTVMKIDKGYTFSPASFDKPGTQTVTVTYSNMSCNLDITVTENIPQNRTFSERAYQSNLTETEQAERTHKINIPTVFIQFFAVAFVLSLIFIIINHFGGWKSFINTIKSKIRK